jgi:hypothetical protein
MVNVVDAFVVSLGLDPTQYNREIKKYRDDRKQLDAEDAKSNRAQEDAQKRLTSGIRSLRNETAGFLLVLAGANSIKDFAANILTGDAATGRLAANLGIATQEASAWEGAIKRVGGTAADIDGALRGLSSAFQSLQLTGSTGKDADFQGLGVTTKDLQNPSDALLKIADASTRMGRPEFNARASRIGLDQNTINLLARGREGVAALLEEQRRLGVTTDQNAESAQRFQDALAKIETLIQGKARPAIENLATVFSNIADSKDAMQTFGNVTVGVLGAITTAAVVAYGPWIALAGAIALVYSYANRSPEEKKSKWQESKDFYTKLQHGDFSGAWDLFKKGASEDIDPLMGRGASASGQSSTAAAGSSSGAGASGAQSFFQANGYTANQARGIVAAISAENNGFDPNATNPQSGAFGLGQWLGPRKKALFAKYGPHPTYSQQLEFFLSELRGGDRGAHAAAIRVIGTDSSGAAARAVIDGFFRPGAGAGGDYRRAAAYLGGRIVGPAARGSTGTAAGGGNQTTSIGQIVVYSAATDADGIARDMRGALRRNGLVVQANSGLTG